MSDSNMIALEADPNDPDDFDVTVEALERGHAERAGRRRTRGPQVAPTKVPVSIRLDADIVARFKSGGPGWQGRINEALRKAL